MIKLFRRRTPWGMREYDVFYYLASRRVLAENAEDAIERAGYTSILYNLERVTVRVVATKEVIRFAGEQVRITASCVRPTATSMPPPGKKVQL